MGTSAVADAIAEKYNTTKSQVLDHVSSTVILFVSAASGTLETWSKSSFSDRSKKEDFSVL